MTTPHFSGVAVTVDVVVLTIRDDELQVLLVERGIEPFRGMLALPGGFILPDEDAEPAARRELVEETALDGEGLYLEQLRTFATPHRDPRGRVITVAYLAIAPDLPVPAGGTDAHAARWQPVSSLLSGAVALAFDHLEIVEHAVDRARSKLEYTTLATAFCPAVFTMTELRRVYEVVWGVSIDARNFHRKVTNADDFLEPTGERRVLETGRPAALYRRGAARSLFPPMLRAAFPPVPAADPRS
ncbi:NUDIX hydrolase [Phytohabitans suffuscus]|uniref:NUDIX hydrolase n=1 Tax=Phytohabitans suffuscus TaxID=624315 RepID=A0A6F8YYR3_9ACTN|nr:NUDIX domain-containing protein [Phytohabitans suffuscus]BCB91206.1 NUDIX hydrolase [Phytohabitans suffuscus]